MTGVAFRPLSLHSWSGYTDASLDHAVWFHRPRRADEWNLFDFQALLNASGRSTIRGTMYGEDGVLYLEHGPGTADPEALTSVRRRGMPAPGRGCGPGGAACRPGGAAPVVSG